MPTPESYVKKDIQKLVETYKSKIDSFWPVPSGYGASHLDCILCVAGRFIAVETKAPGKKPTPRQKKRIDDVIRAGGVALVIDGTDATYTIAELKMLLDHLTKEYNDSASD